MHPWFPYMEKPHKLNIVPVGSDIMVTIYVYKIGINYASAEPHNFHNSDYDILHKLNIATKSNG
jgi:hypothetical protein